jgi:hypothetical protein
MDFYLDILIRGVTVPAVMFAAGLLAARLIPGPETLRRLARGISFGIAFLAAYAAYGWAPLKPDPNSAWHWLAYAPLVAGLLIPAGRWLGPAALALLGAWFLVPTWDDFDRESALLRVASSALLLAAVLSFVAERFAGGLLSILWLVVFVGASVVVMLSGFALLAQLAAVVPALLGVCAIASWIAPSARLLRDVAPGVSILLAGILWSARFVSFSEVPLASYLLVLLAPLASLLMLLPPCRRLGPRQQHALHILGVLVPLAVAVALGWFATASDAGDDEGW